MDAAGKKAVSADEFIRGDRSIDGDIFLHSLHLGMSRGLDLLCYIMNGYLDLIDVSSLDCFELC